MAEPTPAAVPPPPRVLGVAGWSGAGKTTLLVRLIPLLAAPGLKGSPIKRPHHDSDTAPPGRAPPAHRRAGAGGVVVAPARRWALIHELREEPEQTLADLLRRLSP